MKPKTILVNGYSASPNKINLGTFGSYGNEILKFNFSEDWNGLSIYCVFHIPVGKPIKSLIGNPESFEVPHEVTENKTNGSPFNIVGYKDGKQIISTDLTFTVYDHSDIDGEEPTEPTPDIFQQILDISKDAQEKSEEAIKIAGESEQKAKVYAEQAEESADQAKQSATDAAAELEKVQSAGNQAVQDIGNASQTALEGIDSAKDGALTAISQAQSTGVQAVQNAQTTGVDAVQNAQSTGVQAVQEAQETAETAIEDAKTGAVSTVQAAQKAGVEAVQTAQAEAEQAIKALVPDVYTKTESDARFAPIQSAIMVSGKGDGLTNLQNTAPWYMQGLSLYGKTTQDGIPSPENQVPLVSSGDSGSVDVTVCGAQQLNFNLPAALTNTSGVLVTDLNYQACVLPVVVNKNYYISGNFNLLNSNNVRVGLFKVYPTIGTQGTRTEIRSNGQINPMGNQFIVLSFLPSSPATFDDVKNSFMISVGDSAQSWQPYQSQLLPIPTPNGLPGIPVNGDENYTDSLGQKWICNVVDLESEIAIQNVDVKNARDFLWKIGWDSIWPVEGTIVINTIDQNYKIVTYGFCNILKVADIPHGEIGFSIKQGNGALCVRVPTSFVKNLQEWNDYIMQHDVWFVLPLKTPITTPLSAETIAAYKALQSYQGQTNVIAADCGIQATAMGDGTAIITGLANKIAALESAQTGI